MSEPMIKTLKPYAYVDFNLMKQDKSFIAYRKKQYVMYDSEFTYVIDKETYDYLESRGIKVYGKHPTT